MATQAPPRPVIDRVTSGSTPWGWAARLRIARTALGQPLAAYYLLLAASALLLVIGLIMVLSSSSVWSYKEFDGDSYAVVRRQLLWVLIGVPAALIASRLPIRFIRALAWPGFGLATVLLALTTTRLGATRNAQTNWLDLGPVEVQPSELAKLAVIIWAAHVYANKERRLDDVHHLVVPVIFPGMVAVIGLVLWEGDLGTALVLFAIALAMLWVIGTPGKLFALALGTIAALAAIMTVVDAERMQRLTSFTDPFRDFADGGWQPAHGLFALSSGGFFGQGIGASQQKWGRLPEAHTDFIFAVLGEELGLVGTLLVIVLFLAIAYAAIQVASQTRDPFVRYVSFGIMVWLLGQMMLNVGMVVALLPVIGIPLPLVSYGGSALMPSLVALGLLIGFARREPRAARALAARRRRRSR
ncbi:MAG: putative lipid II flippase FtsW [Nocardioides sp.]